MDNCRGTHQQNDPESDPDRISELLEPLLIYILSFLPMKDAVKTCILSKKWIKLWTHVDRIIFKYDPYGDRDSNLPQFISFVDHTLMQCTFPKLKIFSFRICSDSHCDYELVDKWVHYVCEKNVEFLRLELKRVYDLPPKWFYKNSSLSSLELCRLEIKALGGEVVSWSSLKSLSLKRVCMSSDVMAKILLGCPMLETMSLQNFEVGQRLNIVSKKLKKLKLETCMGGDDVAEEDPGLLEINAPWLQELEILGYFAGHECRLLDVSSLVYATLNFWMSDHLDRGFNVPEKLLQRVHHVKELTLGLNFIEALSRLKMSGEPSILFKCRKLTILSYITENELPGIVSLLENSPHLEILTIEIMQNCFYVNLYDLKVEEYMTLRTGNFGHIKNVIIDHRRKYCSREKRYDKSFEFELVAYLLRNGCVPEKVVITSQRHAFYECLGNCKHRQYLSALSHKLLDAYLNGYEDAEWEFGKEDAAFKFTYSCSRSQLL